MINYGNPKIYKYNLTKINSTTNEEEILIYIDNISNRSIDFNYIVDSSINETFKCCVSNNISNYVCDTFNLVVNLVGKLFLSFFFSWYQIKLEFFT